MDRKQALIQFYEKCVEKGYTDMSSEGQRLDAKVVAADLRIKYKDIGELFDEAKIATVQANAEAERKRIDGQLLVTVGGNIHGNKTSLEVFLRPDGSVYSVLDAGDKIEGAPKITVNKGGTLSYTYNPSKAIYTGATVGGITTGGVEYTKASYSEKVVDTGKGYIDVALGGKAFTVHTILFSSFIRERFKRNDSFQRLAGKSGIISCRKSRSYANGFLANSLLGADYKQQMTMLSRAADDECLPYSQCVEIANLLGLVVNKDFPPLDEEIYSRAVALLKSSDSMKLNQAEKLLLSILDYKDVADLIYTRAVDLSDSNASSKLNHAIELFDAVTDYKDSKSRVSDLKAKIEIVIHEEKKEALLRREANAKRGKKLIVIGSIAIASIVIVAVVFSKTVMPAIHYKNAEQLLAAGDYDGAMAAFEELGDYKDSATQMNNCYTAIMDLKYNDAVALMDVGNYEEAIAVFEELGNYKNSEIHIEEMQQLADYDDAWEMLNSERYNAAYNAFVELGDYADSSQVAAEIQRQNQIIAQLDEFIVEREKINMNALNALVHSIPGDANFTVNPDYIESWYNLLNTYMPFYGSFRFVSGDRSILESIFTYETDRNIDWDLYLTHTLLENPEGELEWHIGGTYRTTDGRTYEMAVSFEAPYGSNDMRLTALRLADYRMFLNDSSNLVIEAYNKDEILSTCVFEKVE